MKSLKVLSLGLVAALLLTGCAHTKQPTEAMPSKAQIQHKKVRAAQINVQLGLAFLQKKDTTHARQKLMLAKREAPNEPSVWYGLGYFTEKTGNPKDAEKFYRRAVQLNPKAGTVHNNYGTFLCRQKRYRESLKEFTTAVTDENYLDPGGAYENAGMCALQIPDRRAARQFFKSAVEKDPNLPIAFYQLAKLSYQDKQFADALKYLKQFDDISKPLPQTLAMEIKVAKQLGDQKLAKEKLTQLVEKYPHSAEARNKQLL